MKSLKESIFDDVEDIASDDTVLIEQFLKDNYIIEGTYKIDASYTINDNVVDVKGHVIVKNEKIESLTNGLFRFGTVNGNFYCTGCPKLKTLEGAPKKVNEDFDCSRCKNLKSLEGGPEMVSRNFDCSDCPNLASLKGSPMKVGGDFDCGWCESLTSLKGGPGKVTGDFYCRNCKNLKITNQDRSKYSIES